MAVGAGWNTPQLEHTLTKTPSGHNNHELEDDVVPPSPSKMSSIVSLFVYLFSLFPFPFFSFYRSLSYFPPDHH
jgi:hypothetical protein